LQFTYVDTGLVSELGHHAFFCRHVVREIRNRGYPTTIFGHANISQELRAELDARPLFRCYTYQQFVREGETQWDPLCGWLSHFDIVRQTTKQDLDRIDYLTAGDLLYVNSAMPPQLMAVVEWFKQKRVEQRPKVVVELNLDPGVYLNDSSHESLRKAPDPRVDSRPTLYRYVSKMLKPGDEEYLKLMTFDAPTSKSYENVLNYPVAASPMPHKALTDCHTREGKKLKIVSLLGHQRPDKGYSLVPEIAARLLSARQDIVLMVHNGCPAEMIHVQQSLRALAASQERLILNEQTVSPELWSQLLDASDLIICPYDPVAFKARCSGIANEGIANSIPIVVPSNTSLADLLDEFEGPGTKFDQHNTGSVVEATVRLLDNFDHFARIAHEGSRRWEDTRGSSRLIDALLAWQQSGLEEPVLAPLSA